MITRDGQPANNHAASDRAWLPARSDLLCRWFRWWVRGYLRKHFHAIRLARGTQPDVPSDLPLIVVLNHPSWWDPLIGVVVAGLWPERAHYAPMDDSALKRYSLLGKLGIYGVEQRTTRGAVAFLRTTTAILFRRRTAVWITAQGRFTDPLVRPAQLRRGVGHVARRLDRGVIATLALEYLFWDERLPEVLCRFGRPIVIKKKQALMTSEWVERIQTSLTSAQDALRDDALSRDPSRFETLLQGKVAIGGIYDCGRRLQARRLGERFRPEHGSERERP